MTAPLLSGKAHEDVPNPQGIHFPTTSPIIDYHHHLKFLLKLADNKFPNEWKQAMDQEMQALEKNQTWELTELPPRKKILSSK